MAAAVGVAFEGAHLSRHAGDCRCGIPAVRGYTYSREHNRTARDERRGCGRAHRGWAGRGHYSRGRPRPDSIRSRVQWQDGARGDEATPGDVCGSYQHHGRAVHRDAARQALLTSAGYENSIHNIKGIVYTADVLQVPDTEAHVRNLDSIMRRDVYFVPESKLGSDLLREMQKQNVRMAIVVDEYGGV